MRGTTKGAFPRTAPSLCKAIARCDVFARRSASQAARALTAQFPADACLALPDAASWDCCWLLPVEVPRDVRDNCPHHQGATDKCIVGRYFLEGQPHPERHERRLQR